MGDVENGTEVGVSASSGSADLESPEFRAARNAAYYRGRWVERRRAERKEQDLVDALIASNKRWRDRAHGAEGQLQRVHNAERFAIPPETTAYIERLEHMALNDDGYRCEACRLVFDVDDIEFHDDCNLCKQCSRYAREMAREPEAEERSDFPTSTTPETER